MAKLYYTTEDLVADLGLSTHQLYRRVKVLTEAKLIHPWRSEGNQYTLSLHDASILRRFSALAREHKNFTNALYALRIELLEQEHAEQKAEIQRLNALVEVKLPWWKRVIDWWHRIQPCGKVGRSQRQ